MAGEAVPALQHMVHGPGRGGMARQPGAFGAHPVLKVGEEGRALFAAHRETALGGLAVGPALDVEQRVDPRQGLHGEG